MSRRRLPFLGLVSALVTIVGAALAQPFGARGGHLRMGFPKTVRAFPTGRSTNIIVKMFLRLFESSTIHLAEDMEVEILAECTGW